MSRSGGLDRRIKIFSPEGKLYQIEYAFKAIQAFGSTTIGMKGKDSVVVVAQKKVQDKLIDPASVTSIFRITERIGTIMAGNLNDARALQSRMIQEAAEFELEHGYTIPVRALAARMADLSQAITQYAFMRPMCVISTIVGIDEEFGPQVYKVDPAGHYQGYRGVAAGTKEQEALTTLEKQYKKLEVDGVAVDKVIQSAISVLQNVVGVDFKETDLEVGVATIDRPEFRKLSPAEIEIHLNAISEKI